ncbi:M23 family metallopeptidase [Nocardioides alkalitolerans]|uniref:M23 family metallopeptidase n=1 Tax=Nocardioides alkalitolerans TaxID=281714 RepID=UPI0004296596|nr:M23 family metallopeptidase [Nocardioides alkalitolerans]
MDLQRSSAILLAPVVLVAGLVFGFALLATAGGADADASCRPGGLGPGIDVDADAALPPVVGQWDAEQVGNAVAIIRTGAALELSLRAQTIAVMTAMGESSLRVIDYGDTAGPDSRGLFQQRANGAWGSYEDRMDPVRSSVNFYRALVRVEGWEAMEPTMAAHKTQRNADPFHYERWWPEAVTMVQTVAGTVNGVPLSPEAIAGALTASSECSTDAGTAPIAVGDVTWPVPAHLADADRGNWGNDGGNWARGHTGTDFSVLCGTPVLAAHAGVVEIDTGQSWAGPWLVKVVTGPDTTASWYAHMQAVNVTAGQQVTPGQQLGEVGSEGNSTGCHLHFEIHSNNGSIYEDNVNPSTWLRDRIQ